MKIKERMTKKVLEDTEILDAIDIATEQLEWYNRKHDYDDYYYRVIDLLNHIKVSRIKEDYDAYHQYGYILQAMLIDM